MTIPHDPSQPDRTGTPAVPLTVAVTSYDGAPLAGAQVTRTAPDRTTTTATTDERGRARFDAPASEPAEVGVVADGLAPDTRATGGGYPLRPDGVEQFVLGPAGLPAYFRGRVRVPFEPVLDAVGVRVETPTSTDATRTDLDALSPEPTDTLTFADGSVAVVRLSGAADDHGDTLQDMNRRVSGLDTVGQVGALVALTETAASFLTDSIVVSFLTDDVDPTAVAARHDLEVVKQHTALPRTWVMRSPAGAGYDLLDVLAAVAAEPGVRYAEPDLVTTVEQDAVVPGDFLFPQQWDHPLIRTPDAWQVLRDLDPDLTFGDPAITVGVVDSGIDATHPAMASTLTDGTAKVSALFDFTLMVANNDSTAAGDHGMCCAGSAAGATDNGEGTAGVAGNCHVIGVRSGGTEARFAEMYLWLAGLDAGSGTAGFPAQLTDGADVITNSFGFNANQPISALMQDTFDTVTDQGRNGRGTLLFFSAGNNTRDLDTTNNRPWSMYGRCYGVAASTLDTDGVTEIHAGYSNWGSTIDFCAPSHTRFRAGTPAILHDPTTEYGAFSSTRADAPEGMAVPGSAVATTTLSTASAAGATTIVVASVGGAVVNGSVLVGPATARTARGRRITAIDAATRTLTLELALPAAFAVGTAVTFAPHRYTSVFGGTSHATPVAAGVAALMLSANPQLSWQQVGRILQETATRIEPGETDPVGRWRDVDGRISSDPGYRGPSFSEWFGAGRIDAAAAVTRAAWTINARTESLEFLDVPEGEEAWRAVRFDVHSIHDSAFDVTVGPGAPFTMPLGTSAPAPGTADYDTLQEVYLWVSYTGTTAGSSSSGSITVTHDTTGQTWTVPISANTVERTTACVMLVLDQSGSMVLPSGVGTLNRNEVLRYSSRILGALAHEGDGIGIVAFDHDPSTVRVPPVGPLGPPSVFDPMRDDIDAVLASFPVNNAGATSIGDGLELGQASLGPVTGYSKKATVVFTDGYENDPRWIADVGSSITDRTYAVALGRAENIRPATLDAVTRGTGGYCVLTDDLTTGSRYKLAKYFLQVFAGVTNDQVVVDPPVDVAPGATVEVPFELAETDFVVDVILMTELPWLVEMTLVTPAGDVVDPAFMAGLSGRSYVHVDEDVVYYRLTLPAPIGRGAHDGTWSARFHLDEAAIKEAASDERLTREQLRTIARKGISGTMLVHASSNLRLEATTQQKSFEPGAEVHLRADLTEYGVPVDGRARVEALVTDPAGVESTIAMQEVAPGAFEAGLTTTGPGVWTVLFRADGSTFRGTRFTREAVRTATVWRGGDRYQPEKGKEPGGRGRDPEPSRAWQHVLRDPQLLELLRRRLSSGGFDLGDLQGPSPAVPERESV